MRQQQCSAVCVFLVLLSLRPAFMLSQVQQDEVEPQVRLEIPFKLYNHNLVIVQGKIGPLENQNIVLDTGTDPSAISRNVAQLLKLQGRPELVLTLNGATPTEGIRLPPIQIGSLRFHSPSAVVLDLDFLKQQTGIFIGAILGIDVLKARNFTIDYARKKLIFGAAESRHLARFQIQPLLLVRAKIEHREFRLVLDSATPGLLLYRNRIKEFPDVHARGDAWVVTASGTAQSQWFASRIMVGTWDLGRHPIVIGEMTEDAASDFDGLLGFAQMGFRRVSFDFTNGLFGWD